MLVCDYKYNEKKGDNQIRKIAYLLAGGVLRERTYIYYHTHNNMKQCLKCKEIKPLTDFCKNKHIVDGHHTQCKACVKTYQQANKEKLKEYQRNYQPQYKAEHRDELLAYLANYQKTVYREKHLAYLKEWKKRNPEKVAQYRKVMAERKQQANGQ